MDKDEYQSVEDVQTDDVTSDKTEDAPKDEIFEFTDWALI